MRRFKKLIAAAHISYNTVIASTIFNCNNCTQKDKKRYGCKAEKKHKKVWVHEGCPVCKGKNTKCEYCNGNNYIEFKRCVHKSVSDFTKILPFYIEYFKYGVFPDRKGRIFQPIKLLESFTILDNVFDTFIRKQEKEKK